MPSTLHSAPPASASPTPQSSVQPGSSAAASQLPSSVHASLSHPVLRPCEGVAALARSPRAPPASPTDDDCCAPLAPPAAAASASLLPAPAATASPCCACCPAVASSRPASCPCCCSRPCCCLFCPRRRCFGRGELRPKATCVCSALRVSWSCASALCGGGCRPSCPLCSSGLGAEANEAGRAAEAGGPSRQKRSLTPDAGDEDRGAVRCGCDGRGDGCSDGCGGCGGDACPPLRSHHGSAQAGEEGRIGSRCCSGEYVAGPGLVMSRGYLRRRLAAHSMSARLPPGPTAHWPRSRPPLEGRRAGRTKPWRTTASPLRATVSTGVGGVAAMSNREVRCGRPASVPLQTLPWSASDASITLCVLEFYTTRGSSGHRAAQGQSGGVIIHRRSSIFSSKLTSEG
jgi:hypothetical protein